MEKFQVYYPVKPFEVIQGFGVNGAYYQSHGINILGHNGYDLKAYHGQPIYATHDGTAYYEVDGNQGHGVVIISDKQYDYEGTPTFFKTVYWHMVDSKIEPKFKSPIEDTYPVKVKAGDLIGYADNTGLSTGDHLHFAIKPVAKQSEAPFAWINFAQNNGYGGCVDPGPYFNGLYAEDINNPPPKHTFYIPMKYGDMGQEVVMLQKCLQSIGYFPKTQECTGYYGSVTRGAVFQFQRDYAITDVWSFIAVWSNFGNNVGPITLKALNKQFA